MRTLVVAGHGMVGHRMVEALIGRDVARQWRIVILAEEGRHAYDRVALSSYVDSWDAQTLALPVVEDDRVELRLGDPCVAIDRRKRAVRTASGHRVAYDALVLATGSAPFVPPVPGHDVPGCYVYRTPEDLDAIRAAAQRAMQTTAAGRRSGVVVGGGLLGLEAAHALRQLGLSPHVVEIAPRLMPMQVDEGGGALLRRFIENLGVRVHCGNATQAIEPDRGRLLVRLADGTELDTDVVVFSAGVRPRDTLAREAGLSVGERGGVLVDNRCRTYDEDIWAIGECAAVEGRCYGLVAPGYAMAEVVADRLLGGNATFPGADMSTKLKLLGVDVASFGDAHGTTDGALEVVHNDPIAGRYAKLVVSDDARTLLGGVLVGDAEAYSTLRALVGAELPADPGALISPSGAELDASALPAGAQVCSCHAVTVETIGAAVTQQGCTTVPALKACTKAGTGCGSCVPMLAKLLAAHGVEQSRALCEHFAHSRAELFEIVAATRIHTFSELVSKHGKGRGCDICKPAVASILASLSGVLSPQSHILDGEQATLQDTNDHFLANLQRNGTYSVIPRIPGGEVTPEKLIVIGEVARDFGLYTKITGGQRIDMFGA
ncbi:MAG: nitrite reductase large subunit NirB, partial [Actinomycetota bacterium]|nr:nitrite reductase large subunit NirB [Actinomycetota bacterium]